jgi:hypothetical protein
MVVTAACAGVRDVVSVGWQRLVSTVVGLGLMSKIRIYSLGLQPTYVDEVGLAGIATAVSG